MAVAAAQTPSISSKSPKKLSLESSTKAPGTAERTRLHITPLDPTLLPTIIPPSVLPEASNISYHTIETFPERRYGYVELPTTDADKLRRKLNGSILKGTKIRIEVARPAKTLAGMPTANNTDHKNGERRRKRQRREEGVLPGFELPNERHVQRGWTKPASEKIKAKKEGKEKQVKSQVSAYTDKPECLFRTKLPPNAADLVDSKKKRKKTKGNQTVLHEFETTAKVPSFLRGSGLGDKEKAVMEYVDGKGWVDAHGNVVEEAPKSSKAAKGSKKLPKETTTDPKTEAIGDAVSMSPGVVGSTLPDVAPTKPGHGQKQTIRRADETSSSGTSSESDDDETSSSSSDASTDAGSSSDSETDSEESSEAESSSASETDSEASAPSASEELNSTPKKSNGNGNVNAPTDKPTTPPQAPKEVHPLETLFKRPTQTASSTLATSNKLHLEIDNTFNFFNPDNEASTDAVPPTPFTQRDLMQRGLRSGAPTPDTPWPGKTFQFFADGDEEEEADEEMLEVQSAPSREVNESTTTGEASQEKSFVDWFYEHRGETNRAWKKRRRICMKEKRKRENKRLGRTVG